MLTADTQTHIQKKKWHLILKLREECIQSTFLLAIGLTDEFEW